MSEFPFVPVHQPEDVPVEATEEVVPDSGDHEPAPADEEAVVDKPVATKPAAKKAPAKTRVKKGKK